MDKTKAIAMYLPQFHRTPENDKWWGEGFTEWTAVRKGKPLFEGHNQPREPLNDNYYDLLDKSTMEWQARTAKEYKVYGFCFYHYWFKDGRRTLDKPAENLLRWKDIDMPFCFAWANEAWVRTWSNIKTANDWMECTEEDRREDEDGRGILLEQKYGREQQWKEHFEYLLPFFEDERYITVEGKPLFIIYKPKLIPCLNQMLRYWKKLAAEYGLPGLYIIVVNCESVEQWSMVDARLIHEISYTTDIEREATGKYRVNMGNTTGIPYDYVWQRCLGRRYPTEEKVFLGCCVDFDTTPRRKTTGITLLDGGVEKFSNYFKQFVKKNIEMGNEYLFINAWNEWGEGMYLEPDKRNGYGYLKGIHDAITELSESTVPDNWCINAIYGAAEAGKRVLDDLKKKGIYINICCDDDKAKWGTEFEEKLVIPISKLKEMSRDSLIIIADGERDGLREELKKEGFAYVREFGNGRFFNERITYPRYNSKIKPHVENALDPRISIVVNAFGSTPVEIYRTIDSIQASGIQIPYEVVVWRGREPELRANEVAVVCAGTMVQAGWIDRLLVQYENSKRCCIVGSKIANLEGNIQQAGIILWNDYLYEFYGYGEELDRAEYEYVRRVDAISIDGVLMHKELWEAYAQTHHKREKLDADIRFCLSLRKKGVDIIFQPLSLMIWLDTPMESKGEYLLEGREEWEEFIQSYQYTDGADSFEVIDRTEYKYNMFLTDDAIARFDKDAGHRAVYNYIKIFMEMGMRIFFFPDNLVCEPKYTEFYQQMGIFVVYGEEWKQDWRTLLRKYLFQFDYAFLNRPLIAVKYVDYLRQNSDMVITHFGHDLHYLRLERQYELEKDETVLEKARELKEIEFSLIQKVDHTGYPSAVEVEILKKEFPQADIRYFPLYYFEYKTGKVRSKKKRKGILTVGSIGHPPNNDAIKWLVNEILPEVRKRGIRDTLYIVGSNPTDEIMALEQDGVKVLGFVEDEKLAELYDSCKATIAPLRFGAGMKGKVLEAMYHGIPMVTTDIGAEGLTDIDDILYIGNTREELAAQLINVYEDKKEAEERTEKGIQYILKRFGKENMKKLIQEQLRSE